MSSILLSAFLTAVSGVVSTALGYELFNKSKTQPLGPRDAGLLIGGMVLSACLTPILMQAAETGLNNRNIPLTKWNFKIAGLGVTQFFGYSALFFRLLRPYFHRIDPAFSFGYCIVQLSANAYTLYNARKSD